MTIGVPAVQNEAWVTNEKRENRNNDHATMSISSVCFKDTGNTCMLSSLMNSPSLVILSEPL